MEELGQIKDRLLLVEHLSPVKRAELNKTHYSIVNMDTAMMLLEDSFFRIADDKTPIIRDQFKVFDDGKYGFVLWETNSSTAKLRVLEKHIQAWDDDLGPVRNQLGHSLCWIYATSDLISSLLLRKKVLLEFVPLCPHHLCHNISPEKLGKDPFSNVGHICYGGQPEDVIDYVAAKGAIKETASTFKCLLEPPAVSQELLVPKIGGYKKFSTLEEALKQLVFQPVGASLALFSSFSDCKATDIYRGPTGKNKETFLGYHSIIMSDLQSIKDEMVVRCKLSNGKKIGDRGYLLVSLNTMYLNAGFDDAVKTEVDLRANLNPQYLLTDFLVPTLEEVPSSQAVSLSTMQKGRGRRDGDDMSTGDDDHISKKQKV